MDSQQKQKKFSQNNAVPWIGGVLFTFLIALLGFLLTKIPGFNQVGQLASAIIIAVLYRQFFGYPKIIRNGVTFSTQKLLRLAIMLYGLKLNIQVVFQDGLGLLVRDAIIITFAILFTMWLAKRLKADGTISLLLGVGTGVCGAAAIAAISPIIKAKDEDTAISVGIIALMGTVFSIIYTIMRPILPLDPLDYGIWSGLSLHELAHVAIAAEPAGNDALAVALLAKLGRVFLLVPLSFIFIYMMKRKSKGAEQQEAKVSFPYFLLGFIFLSILGSYVFGHSIPVSDETLDVVSNITTWLLTAAMVGLGLNVSLKDVRTRALKPLIAMTVTSILVSLIAYVMI